MIVLGLLLALALGYNAFRSWQASSQLEARLAKLREQGAALTLDELDSPALPEEDNAQTWIRRARPHTEQLSKLLREYYATEEYQSLRPNAEQQKLLREAFEQHAKAFSHYQRAASCVGYQSDWRIGPQPSESLAVNMENVSETREVLRHCRARASWLLAENKTDETLTLGLQMLALSRHVEYEPMVMGYLVSLACRAMSLNVIGAVLERSPLTDARRQEIDSALAECESADGFQHALDSERIYGLASFRQIVGGTLQSMVMWTFKSDACDYLDLMEDMKQAAPRPRHEIAERLDGIAAKDVGPRQGVGMLTALAAPAILQARNAHDRHLARMRCVRLLNALQGRWPGGIPTEPDLDAFPGSEGWRVDPFTGESLIVRVSEEAVVVYSVGVNGTDDGGDFEEQKDQGVRIELE
ncbi:MAG: hypothetical protein CMJ48_07750 [Planctomycetaceae bacterium]|nr:hypothetical protein [Planctomycetaceae bacterium]